MNENNVVTLKPKQYGRSILDTTIQHTLQEMPFFGTMLQCLRIRLDESIPTAGVMYDTKLQSFVMVFSPQFIEKLSYKERVAVFIHECYHILSSHCKVLLTQNLTDYKEKTKVNISMDLSINQYIKNLPEHAMRLENFVGKNNMTLEPLKAYNYYLENIDWPASEQKHKDKYGENSGLGTLDDHNMMVSDGSLTEEQLAQATKELVQRTYNKSQHGFSNLPDAVKDLVNLINARSAELNYKRIIADAIKKSLPAVDRSGTWKRPSKRYGYHAQGTKPGEIPNIHVMFDSSGSISVSEMEKYMCEVQNILKNLQHNIYVHFFHTNVFGSQKWTKNSCISDVALESGGTDLTNCYEVLKNVQCDLVLFFTDGYYSDVDVKKSELKYENIFIISKGGDVNHPLTRLGTTIQMVQE